MSDTINVLDTHNQVTATELEKIVEFQLESIKQDKSKSSIISPILIHGSPGLGKSTIVRDICKKRGLQFIDVRLAEMEPCDIKGLPVPDKEHHKMQWFVNGTWPDDPNSEGVIFLDEITSADRSIQVAAYELVLDRKLGDLYKVPDGWYICAAGNTVEDQAVATTMSSALANRFLHVQMREDLEAWLSWARSNDIHPAVIGFLQYRPSLLLKMEGENLEMGWPSPRSWHRVSQVCHDYENMKLNDESFLRKMVFGLVGNGSGVEFMTFYETNLEFENVLNLMRNEKALISIPDKPDKKFAMISSMVYNLWRPNLDEAEQTLRIDGFLRICTKFTSDFACMALAAAVDAKEQSQRQMHAKLLLHSKRYPEWKKEHQDALAKRSNLFKF